MDSKEEALHPTVDAWLNGDESPGWELDDPEVLRRIREEQFLELHDRYAPLLQNAPVPPEDEEERDPIAPDDRRYWGHLVGRAL